MTIVHMPAETMAFYAGLVSPGVGTYPKEPPWWLAWRSTGSHASIRSRWSVSACAWRVVDSAGRDHPSNLRSSTAVYLTPGRTRKWVQKLMANVVTCPDCKVLFDAVCEARP